MVSEFQALLNAAEITKVVWIDDLFEPGRPRRTEATIDVSEVVGTLHSIGYQARHPALASLMSTDPLDVWVNAVESHGRENPDDATLIAELTEAAGGPPGELTPESLGGIVEALGEHVTRLGLKAWSTARDSFLAEGGGSILFLVDREFRVDDEVFKHGDDIVADLVTSAPDASVVMLTHSESADGVARLRSEIAAARGISPDAFAVLTKSQSLDDPQLAERELRGSLHVISVRRACAVLSSDIHGSFGDAMNRAVEDLAAQSVYDLDLSVFESSLSEGASELDVLVRMLQLRQRVHVQEAFLKAMPKVSRVLNRMRRIRALVPDEERLRPVPGSPLIEWRRAEVYDSGDYINALLSPLACGDLFAKTHNGLPCFVLLEQPCDLVVRSDGKRTASEGTFAKVVKKAAAAKSRFYGIPAWSGGGEWSIDFLGCCAVLLRHLELVSYNANGEALIDASKDAPEPLTAGWQRAYAKRREEVRVAVDRGAPDGMLLLTLSERLALKPGKLEGGILRFPLFRVGRLRQPLAMTALMALTAHRTRAAFDHDFARPLRQPESDGQSDSALEG
jgi:hypothetical protein